jgi:hypothetical protein
MRYGGRAAAVVTFAATEGMGTFDDALCAVLQRLREAEGRAVTLRELVALGVPQPAMLVYELQAAGYAIDCVRGSSGELAYRLKHL